MAKKISVKMRFDEVNELEKNDLVASVQSKFVSLCIALLYYNTLFFLR